MADWLKLPRGRGHGRMRSKRAELDRFHSDPNRVAAHLAAIYVAKLRGRRGKSNRRGPYKVLLKNGSKITTHDWALQRAVKQVNSSFRSRQARVDIVKELVRRGRTQRPTFPY
jgi:hypothetical protein